MRQHPILQKFYAIPLDGHRLAIMWLGQNGFLVRSHDVVLLFDPYLSDFAGQWTSGWPIEHIRMHSIPVPPQDVYGVHYVFCSHDHVDHIDPFTIPIIAVRNPETFFVAPKSAELRMKGLYVQENQLLLLQGNDSIDLPPIRVHAIPAAHAHLDYRDESGYPYLSYVVEFSGRTIFHAGDTVPYDGQVDYLAPFHIDLAFLPINGRKDPALNMEPNFSINEAIDFARKIKTKCVIPMHYDMYTINTANIADFVRQAHGRINYKVTQLAIPLIFD